MHKNNQPKSNKALPPNKKKAKHGLLKWLPMAVLSLALMIIIIDTTVLNVSLKTIVNDLNTDIQGIQWVITAYSLTLAAFTITGGRLGDIFGRKKMFMIGAVIFAVGSFITSISHSVGVMIVGESIIEGIGAALMMPATASLLVSTYRGRDRAIAFGIWGGVAGAASALGPILGGYLTTNYSWRWAFRINIFVVILLLLGSMAIAEAREKNVSRKLDIMGILLSSVGLFAFVYGIIESSNYGWLKATQAYKLLGHEVNVVGLSITPIAIIIGIILLALFALWENFVESQGRTPLVSMGIFKNRQFISGASVTALLSLGMVGLIFALPVFLQSVQGLDALHTGIALLPLSLMVLISAPLSSILNKKFTTKRIIQAGLSLAIIASWVLSRSITPTATPLTLMPGLLLFGIGMGFVMAQASNLTLSAVSVEESGEASGVSNTLRQIGSSLGSAIIGAVLLTSLATNLSNGISESKVIPDHAKSSISKVVESQASSVELGGQSAQQQKMASIPANIKEELRKIADEASAKSSSQSMQIAGLFIIVALGASSFLPNTHDLEATTSNSSKRTHATQH
ncbi:MAG: MFS transporter [Candidatus Nomurabacteria bacterium]|nr:MFS transporter [Candidatus Saccharibacteria bacterium]USN95290.1 MAG: MFS transporter [Candidatus Nomurabacteria bacterium]